MICLLWGGSFFQTAWYHECWVLTQLFWVFVKDLVFAISYIWNMCVVIAMNKVQSDQRAVEWNDHFEWMRKDECDLCLLREMCESRPLNFFQQPKLVSLRINQAILFGNMTWTGQFIGWMIFLHNSQLADESESELGERVSLRRCKHYLLKLDTTRAGRKGSEWGRLVNFVTLLLSAALAALAAAAIYCAPNHTHTLSAYPPISQKTQDYSIL